MGSTDSSRYRSHSTSGPEVYLSGYCQVYIEDSPSHPLIKLNIQMERKMFGGQHRQQQVQESQYIRSGSLSLRILPGIFTGQSFHPVIKLNIEMEGEMLVGSTDTAGTGVTVHRVRKFISPDIARYIQRTVLSSTDKTKY